MKKYILKKTLLASIYAIFLSNPENVCIKEDLMEEYLEEQLEYYKKHPETIYVDFKNYETVIKTRGNQYRKLVSHSIKDIENELGDLAYINGTIVGNTASTGDGEVITKHYKGYIAVAVVKINKNSKYPLAIAKYDEKANTVGGIIGWFKDEDIYVRYDNYADVIEMPISKFIIDDIINNDDYKKISDNSIYGIKIDYTEEKKDGYISNYDNGLYVSVDKESSRAKLDREVLKKVLNPKDRISDNDSMWKLKEKYLEEQLNYYKKHPQKVEIDIEKQEIVINSRGEKYKELIEDIIIDTENEFADIACIQVTSIGNEFSTGNGKPTDPLGDGKGYEVVAIVKVKKGAKYPFAVAKYNEETNTIGNIIGWFKDEDIYAKYGNYADVIEMPISKYITYGNIDDFGIDSNGNMINDSYTLPPYYTQIEENRRHGIKVDYTQQKKEGYYSHNIAGLYISQEQNLSRTKLDSENIEKVLKMNIRNME